MIEFLFFMEGGSYASLFAQQSLRKGSPQYECHHLIAKEALNQWYEEVEREQGTNPYNSFLADPTQGWAPAIVMSHTDHAKTLSYCGGTSRKMKKEALKYIDAQANDIIEHGDIIGVLKTETDSIKEIFGDKYDNALKQAWDYMKSLECRHINGGTTLQMKNPNQPSLKFFYRFQ